MKVIKRLPLLYKISSIGKIQEWEISVVEEGLGFATIVTKWGYYNGETQEANETVAEGKNIGKTNATTPLEQAISQAESKWIKQKRFYYAETVDGARKLQGTSTRPMLADKYEKRIKHLVDGQLILAQPKLDGMRCIAVHKGTHVNLTSRGQKPINSAPHVAKALKEYMSEGQIWDGELYNPNIPFEKLMSLARKKEPAKGHKQLQFHMFDVIAPGGFMDRAMDTLNIIDELNDDYIRAVHTIQVEFSETQVETLLDSYEGAGYEGAILRLPDSEYVHKRSNGLLKVKTFHDAEYEIIGCETGTAGTKKDGVLEVFVMITKDGQEFRGPLIGTDDHKRVMWANKGSFIGQWATVKYQEITKYGVPRFPKVKGVRPTSDMS
ncbi:hypothetical protein KAR91_01225 [Candidatus Pacearchaeota archaeon]|nr:hypothetical protein [Candidatus Pacearchaeota archaeon]